MNVARTKQSRPEAVPAGIESTEGKLVYLYLATTGGSAVGELVDRLDVPRITAYSVLSTLEGRGIVEQTGTDTYRAA